MNSQTRKQNTSKTSFGDISKVWKADKAEEEVLDEKLKNVGLCRKKIPKDGACLFRTIADQVYFTQELHWQVRQKCVDFMFLHKEEYEPFICVEGGVPWDHYLFEMRKETTWGGQVEIDSLSKVLKVNFEIYSTHSDEPTYVDNGFPTKILLCYYGNHYDSVQKVSTFLHEQLAQKIVYQVVDQALGNKLQSIEWNYKNVGWECWINQLKAQRKKDEIIAQSLSNLLPIPEYKQLSGYHNKKDSVENNQPRKGKNKNVRPPTREFVKKDKTRQQTKPVLQISEDDELKEVLRQIKIAEDKEQATIRNKEEFPILSASTPNKSPLKSKENEHSTNAWEKSKNWKETFSVDEETNKIKESNEIEDTQNEAKEFTDNANETMNPTSGNLQTGFLSTLSNIQLTATVKKNFENIVNDESDDILFGDFLLNSKAVPIVSKAHQSNIGNLPNHSKH